MDLDYSLLTGNGITLKQAFAMGGETAAVGMSIVFGVLLILMIVLYLFGVIFNKKPKQQKTAAPAAAPVVKAEPAAEEEDEEQLIAVITAAIAASLNTSTYNLNIKSIRRINPGRPAWNRAGLNETINNRF